MNPDITNRVTTLIEPVIISKGLELVDVEYVKEGMHWYLRIYIDKEGGVDLDDCTDASYSVSEVLDKTDFIQQAYMLEVSSPGLERPLKKLSDFERFRGKLISIKTNAPVNGFRDFSGYLQGLTDGEVVLEYKGEQVKIPHELIEKAHLQIEF